MNCLSLFDLFDQRYSMVLRNRDIDITSEDFGNIGGYVKWLSHPSYVLSIGLGYDPIDRLYHLILDREYIKGEGYRSLMFKIEPHAVLVRETYMMRDFFNSMINGGKDRPFNNYIATSLYEKAEYVEVDDSLKDLLGPLAIFEGRDMIIRMPK